MASVLLSSIGSAGDVLPLVPIAVVLRQDGHRVSWLVNFDCAGYLRRAGQSVATFGTSPERGFPLDQRVMTPRFGGWASWREGIERYQAPRFSSDFILAKRLLGTLKPDVVVAVGVNPAIRTAAKVLEVPMVSLSFSPQHVGIVNRGLRLASSMRAMIESVSGIDRSSEQITNLIWGADSVAVLTDPTLVDPNDSLAAERSIGYPYFDLALAHDEMLTKARAFIDESRCGVMACCLGSISSPSSAAVLDQLTNVIVDSGYAALVMSDQFSEPPVKRRNVMCARPLPLSQVGEGLVGLAHHGGLGTSIGALRLGLPSVVMPRAFDQPYNARMLESRGAGVHITSAPTTDHVERIVRDGSMRAAAFNLGRTLVSAESAVAEVCRRILR